MPRNAEVIRQWTLLRSIEAARYGLTVQHLAAEGQVTTRTIYRDLDALQEVGFPLRSEIREGHTWWTLSKSPFKYLTGLGFSLSELCALYLSRATHRISSLSVLADGFTPSPEWAEEPFASSLGPFDGKAVRVALRFEPSLAALVRERQYHASQRTELLPDGSLRLDLDVCDDAWLRSFILQFGHRVQVLEPEALAKSVVEEFDLARRHYAADMPFEPLTASPALLDLTAQWRLPFEQA